MKEREGFVKDSKVAMKGIFNGVFGSLVYELILVFLLSFFISMVVSTKNPNVSGEGLKVLVDEAYKSFPYSILLSCLVNLAVVIVFVYILKFDVFKNLCKKAINSQTIKYGVLTAIVIMASTVLYKLAIVNLFDLESGNNANQVGVESLIKSSPILGFLLVVILAPTSEELTYRYCMFGELSKKRKFLAYTVSGLVFMAMHGIASFTQAEGFNKEFLIELIYLPPYLFSGLALCYAYDKTSNIGSSFLAHLINNLISFASVVFLA